MKLTVTETLLLTCPVCVILLEEYNWLDEDTETKGLNWRRGRSLKCLMQRAAILLFRVCLTTPFILV